MRRIAAGVLLVLSVSACGGGSDAPTPSPTVTVTSRPTAPTTAITSGDTVLNLPLACHGAQLALTEIRLHNYGKAARIINSTRTQFQQIGDPVADRLGQELTSGIVSQKVGVLHEAVSICRASHAFSR